MTIRNEFSIPEDLIYMNCSTMGPQPVSVSKCGIEALKAKERPWEFHGDALIEIPQQLRARFANLLAAKPEQIAIIPSVGYGISLAASIVARKCRPGKILVLDDQFPSNIYPWTRLKSLGFQIETLQRDLSKDLCEQVLNQVDEQTRVVAVPNVHWSDGQYLDLKRLGPELKKTPTLLVVDVIQSLGILPTSWKEIEPDILVTGCYKWLLGPYGMGLMCISEEYFDQEPIEQAWMSREGSEDLRNLTQYTEQLRSDASRFDMGGKSFVNMEMAAESLKRIFDWKPQSLLDRTQQITKKLAKELADQDYRVLDENVRSPHILGIEPPPGKSWPEDLLETLMKEKVSVALRGPRLRISPNGYNEISEVPRFLEALEKAMN